MHHDQWMMQAKEDILARLQKEILNFQGSRSNLSEAIKRPGLGPMDQAFPEKRFPLGVVHEFIAASPEDAAASTGFISGILHSLMQGAGACIWISNSKNVFPPALPAFGIAPDKIIFVTLQKEKELLWCMEEALKCNGLAAVVGEINALDFTASRRMQLAVEQSGVTGFILRRKVRSLQTNACFARWKIGSASSITEHDLPGVGHPSWKVQLLKVRNGRPGTWTVSWIQNKFRHIHEAQPQVLELQRKTG